MTDPNGWFEVWADETADPPYVLLVRPAPDAGEVEVLDPSKEYTVVHTAASYEDAKLWLLEDEFLCVHGRVRHDEYA